MRRVQESKTIFTLYLRFTDPLVHANYTYDPGQFNMLYLYGVGEVAISIVSDPEHEDLLVHTINRVGRVTRGLFELKEGQRLRHPRPLRPRLAAAGRPKARTSSSSPAASAAPRWCR
ncbi:MAG: hypothetical protein MZW92_16255 [Comamonadaceae bacterium]|nr:hypothetical protein [Comamonadaceae bacterium]